MTDMAAQSVIEAVESFVQYGMSSLSPGARPSGIEPGQLWVKIDADQNGRGPYVVQHGALSFEMGWTMQRLSDGALVQMRNDARLAGDWIFLFPAPAGAFDVAIAPTLAPYYVADDEDLDVYLGASVENYRWQWGPARRGAPSSTIGRIGHAAARGLDAVARWCSRLARRIRA
jgi:hypothetical protein